LLGDFQLHRSLCLLLHDHGARSDETTVAYIADAQLHQITGSQFAVDRKIEQGKLTRSFSDLEADSNRLPASRWNDSVCSTPEGVGEATT
jgi:hypothetical protein